MCQQNDLIFAQLLQQARIRALTQVDISIFNEKVVTSLILSYLLNNIIIV